MSEFNPIDIVLNIITAFCADVIVYSLYGPFVEIVEQTGGFVGIFKFGFWITLILYNIACIANTCSMIKKAF